MRDLVELGLGVENGECTRLTLTDVVKEVERPLLESLIQQVVVVLPGKYFTVLFTKNINTSSLPNISCLVWFSSVERESIC